MEQIKVTMKQNELCKEHETLSKAIAYFEAKGYSIDIDNLKSI